MDADQHPDQPDSSARPSGQPARPSAGQPSAATQTAGQQQPRSAAADEVAPERTDEQARCLAKGCRAPAVFAIVWNNPTLHTPDREKIWPACAEHRQHLADHLDVRGFLLRVQPC